MYYENFAPRYEKLPIAYHTMSCTAPSHVPYTWMTRHLHQELEILWLKQGRAKIIVGNQSRSIDSGEIIIIPPFFPHEGIVMCNETFELSCICFDTKMLEIGNPILSQAISIAKHQMYILADDHSNNMIIGEYIDKIIFGCREKPSGWSMLVFGNLILAFYQLYQTLNPNDLHDFPLNDTFFSQVITYIEDNFQNDITSKDVADQLKYNQSYFCRRFKIGFGVPFNTYLRDYRLNKARQLLIEDNYSVTELSQEVGFSNPSYFTKCYKDSFGVLPSEAIRHVPTLAEEN